MATQLDLEEQEQLDQLKAFWNQYGNLIVWTLVLALAGFSGWTLWQNHQRDNAARAGALYDQLERAVQSGDIEKASRAFADMKERFPRTVQAQQAGLLAAKLQFEKDQADAGIAMLTWVADNATDAEYKTLARLRLAGAMADQKKYGEALKQLDRADTPEFAALVADRRGDILALQGKNDEAGASYQKAWKAMAPTLEYRTLVDAKRVALGVADLASAPVQGAPANAASSASRSASGATTVQ